MKNKRQRSLQKQYTAQFYDRNHVSFVLSVISMFLTAGINLAGGWLVLSGWNISIGTLLIFIDLTANVINPVHELPAMLAARKAAAGLIDKLALEMETNIRDKGFLHPSRLKNGIELNHVSFGYTEKKEILSSHTP